MICPSCGGRLRYGVLCRACYQLRAFVRRTNRPRCTRCGELPRKRDGLCVLCLPGEPLPSIDVYATARRGGEAV